MERRQLLGGSVTRWVNPRASKRIYAVAPCPPDRSRRPREKGRREGSRRSAGLEHCYKTSRPCLSVSARNTAWREAVRPDIASREKGGALARCTLQNDGQRRETMTMERSVSVGPKCRRLKLAGAAAPVRACSFCQFRKRKVRLQRDNEDNILKVSDQVHVRKYNMGQGHE